MPAPRSGSATWSSLLTGLLGSRGGRFLGDQVPQANYPVRSAREGAAAIGHQADAQDGILVQLEAIQAFTRANIPPANRVIVAPGEDPQPIRSETNTTHETRMPLEAAQL